jgi:hypothetical protein
VSGANSVNSMDSSTTPRNASAGKRSGGAIALMRVNIGRLDGSISPHTRISQSYFSTATISLTMLPADIKVVRHERCG